MIVEVIEGRQAIGELRAEWNAVYEADPEAQYFMSFEWLFGTAAGAGRNGFVLAVRPSGDEAGTVAFLPLRLKTEDGPEGFHNALDLCGNYTSDYNGLICRPEFEAEAIPALARKLQEMHWSSLHLINFAVSERRLDLLLENLSPELLSTRVLNRINPDGTDNDICPFTLLPADWDDYLQSRVSTNTRQKIRRYLRQLEASGEYKITHATADTLKDDIDILVRLWTVKWGPNKGMRLPAIQNSNRRLLRHAFETGTLFLPILWHGDTAVCALAILVDRRKKAYNFYIGGRDESFSGLPSGLVMHAYAIRHAIANGITRYDFLRGNEPYKYSFGAEDWRIRSLSITTHSRKNLGDRLDPRSLWYVMQRASKLHRERQYEAAARGFAQVLEVAPNSRRALLLAGMAAERAGMHTEAAIHYRRLAALTSGRTRPWFRLGRALVLCGDWEAAARAYRALIQRHPSSARGWYLLGVALFRLGKVRTASETFRIALSLKPDYAAAKKGLASATGRRALLQQPWQPLKGVPMTPDMRTLGQMFVTASTAREQRAERQQEGVIRLLPAKTASAITSALTAMASARQYKPIIRNLPARQRPVAQG